MNSNSYTFLLLGVTILFIFVALANTQSSSFSLIPAYSTTQIGEEDSENNDNTLGQIEETETSQENADFEISDESK
ncbi:hypothetical protein [Candidatus Nitrosocosmicus franklandus]|nr:hypothetical protein [Candidatus Nitrosocosmicus franklandus]